MAHLEPEAEMPWDSPLWKSFRRTDSRTCPCVIPLFRHQKNYATKLWRKTKGIASQIYFRFEKRCKFLTPRPVHMTSRLKMGGIRRGIRHGVKKWMCGMRYGSPPSIPPSPWTQSGSGWLDEGGGRRAGRCGLHGLHGVAGNRAVGRRKAGEIQHLNGGVFVEPRNWYIKVQNLSKFIFSR